MASSERKTAIATVETGVQVTIDGRGAHYRSIASVTAGPAVEIKPSGVLERWNRVHRQPAYAWRFVLIGLVLGGLLAWIHFTLPILTIGLSLYIAALAYRQDKTRCAFHLAYQLDRESLLRWKSLRSSLATMAHAERLWNVVVYTPVSDWQGTTGTDSQKLASTVNGGRWLPRKPASLAERLPRRVTSNVKPYCLTVSGKQLFFFPDRIYVYRDGAYSELAYSGLSLVVDQTRYIEEQRLPSDTRAVDSLWHHRRTVPVAAYGVIEIRSVTGMNTVLLASSVTDTLTFGMAFNLFLNKGDRPTQSQQKSTGGQQRHRTVVKPPAAPENECFKLLGLSPTCTKAEASTRYREMAKRHHPDRVNGLSPTVQEEATRKLQEINIAYTRIKQLRGW